MFYTIAFKIQIEKSETMGCCNKTIYSTGQYRGFLIEII
jgi:hypothetical protein